MIGIINYGLGNVAAFENVYKDLNIQTKLINQLSDFDGVSHVILPGVGSFDYAMTLLKSSNLLDALVDMAKNEQIKLLGVCVGMQILADISDEGSLQGLGLIKGKVRSFKKVTVNPELKLPHMGWNTIDKIAFENKLLANTAGGEFYFLHSYFFEPEKVDSCIATSTYDIDFACAVNNKNIYGVQFHPEKSHSYGKILLNNFASL